MEPKPYDITVKISMFIFTAMIILFGLSGVGSYLNQLNQQDWIKTEAIVKESAFSRLKSTGGRHSRKLYNVKYVYTVDGIEYEGIIEDTPFPQNSGTEITVKYDEENPNNSTDILEPSLSALLINIVMTVGGSFFVLSIFGFTIHIHKKIKPFITRGFIL